jgi:glycosyltransferase involved in cell wall biosynthesis
MSSQLPLLLPAPALPLPADALPLPADALPLPADALPEVSVITPTYNRRKFIPALIEIYKSQTYPKQKMEWIVLDDGKDSVADLFEAAAQTLPNLRYIRSDTRLRIGAKRNRLNQEARGKIIVAMDDDDYYPPERVQTVVQAFKKHPRVELAGSSEMWLYYHDTRKVMIVGPYHPNHATNGTMAWRKSYAQTHRYDEHVTCGEEASFLEEYRHPMIQLDPRKTILVICHSDNTVDKFKMRKEHLSPGIRPTLQMREAPYTLRQCVSHPTLYSFYLRLSSASQ